MILILNKQIGQFPNIIQKIAQDLIWKSGIAIYHQYFNLEVQGTEHLPLDRGYLIVANHVSHLDGPAIIAAHGKHLKSVYSLAAKDYFFDRYWKNGFYQYLFNMIPFDRKGKFVDCLKICQTILEQGNCILFFPEGTRSITGEMQPMKLGLGLLVMRLKVPIVPVYISGTYQALPKGMRLPKKCAIKVSFGVPLEFSEYQHPASKEDRNKLYQEIINRVTTAIEDLKK